MSSTSERERAGITGGSVAGGDAGEDAGNARLRAMAELVSALCAASSAEELRVALAAHASAALGSPRARVDITCRGARVSVRLADGVWTVDAARLPRASRRAGLSPVRAGSEAEQPAATSEGEGEREDGAASGASEAQAALRLSVSRTDIEARAEIASGGQPDGSISDGNAGARGGAVGGAVDAAVARAFLDVLAVAVANLERTGALRPAAPVRRSPTAGDADAPPAAAPDRAGAPARLLVAEDNPINQRLIVRILSRLGHQADIASNGVEVLDALALAAYDVVFMDVQMPEMGGLEAATEIGERFRDSAPWIIAMTANASEEDRQACLAAGMDDYLCKPIRIGDVESALARWAASRRG